MEEELEYYEHYRQRLEEAVKSECGESLLKGPLPVIDELEQMWHRLAPEYMADAVAQVNSYPAVAIAWAGYMGMAAAKWWDSDWNRHSDAGYRELCGERGFDYMDEHIVGDILALPIESTEAQHIADTLRKCAHAAISLIRHEQIEHQTTKAFYILANTEKILFRTGISIELVRLGYNYQKVSTTLN